ncbi:MAG: Co2+/Mg2+ efflux protein ApaG [Saprospiraceae bacterium]
METLTTNGITITVDTRYLASESRPLQDYFVFAYHIVIGNGTSFAVQLLRRHWLILDGVGQMREVEGAGVIGQQPILQPGESHAYTSWCALPTEIGRMSGTYLMQRLHDEALFEVLIPRFNLITPIILN